jgi:hypothetical protein
VTAPRLGPWARYLHAAEIARFIADGQHCDHPRCREPVAVYAWYYPNALGGQIGSERQLCTEHGVEFARRQGLMIGPAPEESELPEPSPAPHPGAWLYGMSAEQLRLHEEGGWHCDHPRCTRSARYLSSLHYLRAGRMQHRSRFLCVPHAGSFAVRQVIDMAMVRPPEVPR